MKTDKAWAPGVGGLGGGSEGGLGEKAVNERMG